MYERVKGLISCDKLISVDKRIGGHKGRGRSRRLTLSSVYMKELEQLDHSLSLTGIERNSFDPNCFYSINCTFFLKENFSRRDADNLLKAVIDAITRYLGFNDNKIISHRCCKRLLKFPNGIEKKEFVLFEVEKSSKTLKDLEVNFEDFCSGGNW